MKVTIQQITEQEQEQAVIQIHRMTDDIQKAVTLLDTGEQVLTGIRDGAKVLCPVSKIYYIESVDDKCFLYTKDDCLETRCRLYELDSILDNRFFRCSKSMICNVRKIRQIKAHENARLEATMLNGETVIITRSYVPDFKKRLGL